MHSSTKLVPGQCTNGRRTGTQTLACKTHPARARRKAQPVPPGPPRARLPTFSRGQAQMDLASARALVQCSKKPFGECGKAVFDVYLDDMRDFARRVNCEPACLPPLAPADRCAENLDHGRCRGHVSSIAAAQLCAVHQTRTWGDHGLADLRHLAMLPESSIMTPAGWMVQRRLRRLLNRAA